MSENKTIHTLRKGGRPKNKNDNKHARSWAEKAFRACQPGVQYTSREIVGIILEARNNATKPGERVFSHRWVPTSMKLTRILRRDNRFYHIKRTSSTLWVRKYDSEILLENPTQDDQPPHLYGSSVMSVCRRTRADKKTMELKTNERSS